MNKEKFIKKCEELKSKGYNKNFKDGDTLKGNGLHYYYKTIERTEDKYGSMRSVVQLIFKIYHFEDFSDRVPTESMYALEHVIMVSDDTDERIDLIMAFPEHSVEWLEKKAKEFYDFAEQHLKDGNG